MSKNLTTKFLLISASILSALFISYTPLLVNKVEAKDAPPVWELYRFRFRNDDNTLNNASWITSSDTNVTGWQIGDSFRLRIASLESAKASPEVALTPRIEYKEYTGSETCGDVSGWVAITDDDSSNAFAMYDTVHINYQETISTYALGKPSGAYGQHSGRINDVSGTASSTVPMSQDVTEHSWNMIPTANATGGSSYIFRATDDGSAYNTYAFCPQMTLATETNTIQDHFRWRDDDNSEASATWLETEDTNTTGVAKNDNIRLRFQIDQTGETPATNYQYQLEWAERSGSCDTSFTGESYTAVPDTATTEHFDMVSSSQFADSDPTTVQLSNGEGYTFVAGDMVESTSNSSGNITLDENETTEVEFVFQANSNATDSGVYCFRVTNSGTALDQYDVIAQLTLASGGGGPSLSFSVTTNVFPNLTPGTAVFATSTLSVDTDNSDGWNVTLSADDRTTSNSTMDLDSDASVNIADQLGWIPGGATTTAGNAVRLSSLDNSGDVLAFRVMTASGAEPFRASSWWGSADDYVDNANTLWAGIPSSTASNLRIGDTNVDSGGGAVLNTVVYYLDVPISQTTGDYSGGITYTATMN